MDFSLVQIMFSTNHVWKVLVNMDMGHWISHFFAWHSIMQFVCVFFCCCYCFIYIECVFMNVCVCVCIFLPSSIVHFCQLIWFDLCISSVAITSLNKHCYFSSNPISMVLIWPMMNEEMDLYKMFVPNLIIS